MLIGAGLALLIKAGLDVPVWILVPFPVGVIALMVVTMLRARAARAARQPSTPGKQPWPRPPPAAQEPEHPAGGRTAGP